MGNYKFRFSDMMPNVWFYKLKDMSRTRNRKKQNPATCPASSKTTKQTHKFYPRKSYYFTRELIDNGDGFYASTTKTKSIDPHNFRDPPRKSTKQQSRKINPGKSFPEFRSDCILTTELSELKLELPPIITKVKEEKFSVVKEKKKNTSTNVRKFSVHSPGVRLRLNSPRIRIQAGVYGRKSMSSSSLSGSFAVVKSSVDPQRDFKESMVEMITENKLRASKELEDLLACYLTLNSDEYHDVIIKVFKQIWFDSSHVRMK